MKAIKILYHDKEMPKLEFIGGNKSDWIDVRACFVKINGQPVDWGKDGIIEYKAGDLVSVDLGISMELPEGYEGHLLPRSSTFKNYGFILVNSMGIIDESYCGRDDHWIMQFYALKDGKIGKYDRVGQFRIIKKMGNVKLYEVDDLTNENRGGIGKSGVK